MTTSTLSIIEEGMALVSTKPSALAGWKRMPSISTRVRLGPRPLRSSAEVPGVAVAGKVVLIGEADEGSDRIISVQLPAGAAAQPLMKTFAAVVAPLKVTVTVALPNAASDGRIALIWVAEA